MERDGKGRATSSMIAISPSRVKKNFVQECLKAIVKKIIEATRILLKIVNLNVHGRPYVCADHLRALRTVTQVLNTIVATHSTPDEASLAVLVREKARAAIGLLQAIELGQGTGTTALRDIAVPFHSIHLRKMIPAYKQYLEIKILEEYIDLRKLMAFISNVTAKVFYTDEQHVEEAARVMESESPREYPNKVGP